jgi:hypothetical protein
MVQVVRQVRVEGTENALLGLSAYNRCRRRGSDCRKTETKTARERRLRKKNYMNAGANYNEATRRDDRVAMRAIGLRANGLHKEARATSYRRSRGIVQGRQPGR